MADLRKLFAKESTSAPPAPTVPDNSNESRPVPRAAADAQAATPKPANPFAAARRKEPGDSGEQSTGESAPDSGTPSSGGEPKSGLSTLLGHTSTRDSNPDASSVDAAPITSLESLDSSEDEGVAPRTGVTYFADETPATKPTRELPEGLSKESLGFIDMIDSVYDIIHDPELLGQVIRNIMVELKSNAEYTKLMSPDDVRVMVRGMRESMGLARVKKQEAKAKKSGGTRKSKTVDLDMLADLDSLGIG
jgi:hypothetical protein